MNRLCGVLLILCSCAAGQSVTPGAAQISGLPATISVIDQAAEGYESAQPITVRTSVAPSSTTVALTTAQQVNSFYYSANQSGSAMVAFDLVAHEQGMSDVWVRSWLIAVNDIMGKESRFCWDVRAGATYAFTDGAGCVLAHQGSGDAAGFGQITSVLRPITCRLVGICSAAATVASPHASMAALVAIIRDQGVRPWCYDSFSRTYHHIACNNPGVSA